MKKKPVTKKSVAKKKLVRAVGKRPKKAAKKAANKPSKKLAEKSERKYEHHPDHYNTSEEYLVQNLDEDLKDAWMKIREFGSSLGEQRIYASGRAIMFSKKVCYFFVRPQKSYLEVVIFLKQERPSDLYKSIRAVSKTKFAHAFRLVHSDQVEDELAEAITQAFQETPAAGE